MKLKDLKIGTQLGAGFGIMLLLVAVLGVVSHEQSRKIALQTEKLYNHPLQVRRALGTLKFDISTLQRQIKDYGLAVSETQKSEIIFNIELHKSSALDQIEILYARYLGPRTDVDSVRQNLIKWYTTMDESFRLFADGRTQEAVSRSFPGGAESNQVAMLNKSLEKIDRFSIKKADSLYETSQSIFRMLNLQLYFLAGIILLSLLLLSLYLLRIVKRPINELTLAAMRFRDGDVHARSVNTSKNEFGELAATFNSMIETIRSGIEISNKVAVFKTKMLAEDDARAFFRGTLQMLMEQTGSQMAAAYLLGDDGKNYEHFESIGMDEVAKRSFSANGHEGEFGAAVASRKIQHLKDVPENTRFLYHTVTGKFIPGEILSIPILSGNVVIAIISLATVNRFSPDSLELIEKIHITFASRIEGILAYSRIKEMLVRLEEQNKEMELQQRELSAQSIELSEQNRELETQKNQLSEASKLKSSFLSNMSHELRTPLNSVIALSGVLGRRLANKIPDEEHQYLEVIERNGKNLLLLINDILDISRIETGNLEVNITQFNLCNAINDVVGMIQPQANEKNLDLKKAEGDCDISIVTDASKLRHIVQNLLDNAVKFTEKGEVSISVKNLGDRVVLVVADSGIGISAEHLPHIFDEFRQADSGVARRFGGTGLGLAIAKKYANLLGGHISVSSVPGKGSEFTLTLPLIYDDTFQITGNIADHDNMAKNGDTYPVITASEGVKTIMLIEDSEPVVIQLKDFLEENGYNVEVAKGGAEALEQFKTLIPDAIILDLMMPGIDGLQVLQKIRDTSITEHIPVLILTAKHITKEELQFLTRNNIFQLIQKGDIKRHELVKVVGEMIYGKATVTKKPVETKKPKANKPVVLVVEDNPDNMKTVKAVLADEYTVLEAVNGEEGVEQAKKHLPDVILMDIALPGMDGIQAFKIIRSDGRLQHIPVIALTASALKEDRDLILAVGFDAFIAKPIDESTFFAIIKETLYGK